MIYKFKEKIDDPKSTTGSSEIEIEVSPERWVWGVIYKDGSELHQFGDDGIFHRVGEINQDEVSMATLYKFDDMKKRIDMPWRNGMRLIHKYINFHDGRWENINETKKIYVFGYKFEGSHHFTYVLPDDRIIESPADNVDFAKFNI